MNSTSKTATGSPDLAYYLRRAEEETIAEIRAANAAAASRHGQLARAYGERALALMGGRQPA